MFLFLIFNLQNIKQRWYRCRVKWSHAVGPVSRPAPCFFFWGMQGDVGSIPGQAADFFG